MRLITTPTRTLLALLLDLLVAVVIGCGSAGLDKSGGAPPGEAVLPPLTLPTRAVALSSEPIRAEPVETQVEPADTPEASPAQIAELLRQPASREDDVDPNSPALPATVLAAQVPKAWTVSSTPTGRSWSFSAGSTKTIGVHVNGGVTLANARNEVRLRYTTGAGGAIANVKRDFLTGTVEMFAGRTQASTVTNVRFSVLNDDDYNQTRTGTATALFSGFPTREGEWSTKFKVHILGIGINVTVGARGTCGMSFTTAAGPMRTQAAVSPMARTVGFGDASVGVWGFSAGVDAECNIWDGSIQTWQHVVSFDGRTAHRFCKTEYNQKWLEGKVDVYLKAPLGLKKKWRLHKWEGYQATGQLFNHYW
jgi:hypothetical protein